MADKKEAPKKDYFVEVMFVLLVLGIIVLLWSYIFAAVFGGYASFLDVMRLMGAWFMSTLWPFIAITGLALGAFALIGIIKNIKELNAIAAEEKLIYGPRKGEEDKETQPIVNRNVKWERVISHVNSTNPSDWRLAIIEADIMLDELLRAQGYHGDSIGEMLKGVEKSDMLTLDHAWEAHKVRNEIAHSGSDYLLNERDAKRVVGLFESVFKEFKII